MTKIQIQYKLSYYKFWLNIFKICSKTFLKFIKQNLNIIYNSDPAMKGIYHEAVYRRCIHRYAFSGQSGGGLCYGSLISYKWEDANF